MIIQMERPLFIIISIILTYPASFQLSCQPSFGRQSMLGSTYVTASLGVVNVDQ